MNRKVLTLVLISLLAALLAVGAVFSLPLPPPLPPVTLAVFFALLSGLLLGPWGGLAVTGLYLALGCLGLPVFANGSGGFGHLAGPTGGFLLGYALAAFAAGLISSQRTWHFGRALVGALAGVAVLYLLGLPWFATVLSARRGSTVSLLAAFSMMAPYLVGDVVKACLAAGLIRGLRPVLRNYFPARP